MFADIHLSVPFLPPHTCHTCHTGSSSSIFPLCSAHQIQMPTAPPPVRLRLSPLATATCQMTAQTLSSAQDPAAPPFSHFWTWLTGSGKSNSEALALFWSAFLRICNGTLQLVFDTPYILRYSNTFSCAQNVKTRGQFLSPTHVVLTYVAWLDCVGRRCLTDSPLSLLLILLHLLGCHNSNLYHSY